MENEDAMQSQDASSGREATLSRNATLDPDAPQGQGASLAPASSDAGAMTQAKAKPEPFLVASGLGLETFKGVVYRNVTLEAYRGRLLAVCGSNGSGKTALLLTLAGRMKHTQGTLEADGQRLPCRECKLERKVGLSLFKGLNDLPEGLSARSAASAEFELRGIDPKADAALGYLREWRLDDVADLRVADLTAERLAQLGIALAFVGEPEAVMVDDVEDQLTSSQSQGLMRLLRQQARLRRAAVVVGVTEQALAREADSYVCLTREGE